MKEYILDANAVIRYLQVGNASGGEKVRRIFEEAERGQASLFMSVVNMGEVLYILMKFLGDQAAMKHIKTLQHAIVMVHVDTVHAIQAATLKHQYKLGYADSYAAALALQRKATLVSADGSFQKLGKLIKWLKLPPFRAS